MKNKKLTTNLLILLTIWFLIQPVLAGCGMVRVAAVQPENVNPEITEIDSGTKDTSGSGTIEIGIEATPLPESSSYTNETYGFAFDYPETWILSEQDHGVILQKGVYRLTIDFRWITEQNIQFGRTGLGAGDLLYAGKVNFMDQVIPVNVLSFEKKSKAVLYNETGWIEADDLLFMIALEDLETDYMDVDLSDEIISEAGTILESSRRIDTSTFIQTPDGSSGLAAYLKTQPSVQQGSGEPIMVYFLLENHTQQGLYLLKWYTPLEGIAGDIFEVTRDGQTIPYQGPLASRAAPTPDSYVFVEPDKGVTAEVDIAEAYDFSQLGTYTIKFRAPRISHLAQSESDMQISLDELGPVSISSNEVTLEVVAPSAGSLQPIRRTTEQAGEIISFHLLEKGPKLMQTPALTFEEFPDESVWKDLQGQVFRVTDGIFKNETFLLLHDSVIQLGEAIGGQGLNSLIVTDLDQDGQFELFFSYTAGLGPQIGPGIQTRVGMVEPGANVLGVIDAGVAYLGTAALKLEASGTISLNIVDTDASGAVLHYLDRLGNLSIESNESDKSLIINFDPDLPAEITANILSRY
jgi:hypothetical protein